MQSNELVAKGWKPLSCAFLVIALLASTSPDPAQAGKSHLLQKAEQHVMLTTISAPGANSCGSSSWSDRALALVSPDGTVSTQEFAVPDGRVLVVTDLDWTIRESPSFFGATRILVFRVRIVGPSSSVEVFETGKVIGADLATAGIDFDSASMTAGFRVGPGVLICPSASSTDGSSGGVNSVTSLNLRGYLIKSK